MNWTVDFAPGKVVSLRVIGDKTGAALIMPKDRFHDLQEAVLQAREKVAAGTELNVNGVTATWLPLYLEVRGLGPFLIRMDRDEADDLLPAFAMAPKRRAKVIRCGPSKRKRDLVDRLDARRTAAGGTSG